MARRWEGVIGSSPHLRLSNGKNSLLQEITFQTPALHSNQGVYDLALIHAQEGHILCGRKPAVRGFVIWELSKDVVRVTIASDMPIFGANSAAHVAKHVAQPRDHEFLFF